MAPLLFPWLQRCQRTHSWMRGVLHVLFVLLVTTPLLACGATYVIGTTFNVASQASTIFSLYTSGLMAATSGASEYGSTYIASTSLVSQTQFFPTVCIVAHSMAWEGAVAMFGLAGTWAMQQVFTSYSEVSNIVFFGPLAETMDTVSDILVFNSYNPGIFWTMPLDGAQSLGLLFFLERRPFFPRKQLSLFQNNYGVGLTANILFHLEMERLGVTGFESCESSYPQEDFSLLSSRPGVVYMFDMYIDGGLITVSEDYVTFAWINKLISDPTLIASNSTIITTFYIQYALMEVYQSQLSANKKMLPPQNVISSAPTPGVDSTEYSLSQDFISVVPSNPGCDKNACKNYALAGWVSATALMHALSTYGGPSPQTSYESFFHVLLAAQSSFLVSDLFIGSFGPQSSCTAVAESQGAVCNCNQAGGNIFFTRLVVVGSTVDVVSIPGAIFQYAMGKCASVVPPGDQAPVVTPYTDLFTFSITKQLVGVSPTNNAMMSDMCAVVSTVSSVLSNRTLYRHLAPNSLVVSCVGTTMADIDSNLSSHLSTYVTTSMTGVIPDALVDSISTPSTFVLDFIPQTTQPRVIQSNLVYLFPTLDQELYVLASYLRGAVSASSVVCGVVSTSSASSAILALLTKTLTTFQLTVASGHMVHTNSVLGLSIPSACTHTFVLGLGEGDAAGISSYLQSHPRGVVLLSFDDITKYYSSLQASIGGLSSSLTEGVLFATNLPPWTATPSNPTAAAMEAPLSTVTQFLQSVPESLHTPAAVRAFIVEEMYDLLSVDQGPDPDIQQQLYKAVTVLLNGMLFGPFSMQCTSVDVPVSGTCVGNTGATNIAVWSFARVVNPTMLPKVRAATPSMVYSSSSAFNALTLEPAHHIGIGVRDGDYTACMNYLESSSLVPTNSSSSPFSSSSILIVSHASMKEDVASQSSVDIPIDDLIVSCCAALILTMLVISMLLLWKYRVLSTMVKFLIHCFQFIQPSEPPELGDRCMEEFCSLQRMTADVSNGMLSSEEHTTAVFVEVEHWRSLWVRIPEVMPHIAGDYQRCVREAALRHGCVEVVAVGGLFVVMCPSAFVSIALVEDIYCALKAMRSELREALVTAYASFGAAREQGEVPELRLRIGVDSNSCEGEAIAPGVCSNRVVHCATRAAYQHSTGGVLCVMTERTRSALSGEQLNVMFARLPSLGMHSILYGQQYLVLELYALLPSDTGESQGKNCISLFSSVAKDRFCDFALEMVMTGTESVGRISAAVCSSTLAAFYNTGLRATRVVCLERMLQSFALPAVDRSMFTDDGAYADALVSTISLSCAALLECRHGFLPGELGRLSTGDAPTCRKWLHRKSYRDSGKASERGDRGGLDSQSKSHHRRAVSVVLRRFAYSNALNPDDGSDSGASKDVVV